MSRLYTLLFFILVSFSTFSQILTREDSLSAGLIRSNNMIELSGYGQLKFEYDARRKTGANLTHNVLFIGHRFSSVPGLNFSGAIVNGLSSDGRVRMLMEAILWHGGEAGLSRAYGGALSKADRDTLIKSPESL